MELEAIVTAVVVLVDTDPMYLDKHLVVVRQLNHLFLLLQEALIQLRSELEELQQHPVEFMDQVAIALKFMD